MLDEYPDQLATADCLNGYLHFAARSNQVAVMALLVERGADVDAPFTESDADGPITDAAANGATDAVRWLLTHGASVTVPGAADDPCPGLTLAVMDGHLECVRLLVEAGAPLETSGVRALRMAKTCEHNAVVDYLRSVGVSEDEDESDQDEPEQPDGDSPLSATALAGGLHDLRRHLELQLLGNLSPMAFQELLPSDPPIAVLVLDQFGVRQALVTEGMSAEPMDGPVPYAELVMYLPPDWPLDATTTEDNRHCWPVNWLRRLAHLPHEQGTGYERLAHLDADEPLGPGTRLSTLLLLAGVGERGSYVRGDGETVVLFTVLPIYPEERDFARRVGLPALLVRFQERGLSLEATPDRESVVPID